jgi:hypothetical protein
VEHTKRDFGFWIEKASLYKEPTTLPPYHPLPLSPVTITCYPKW